HAVDVIAIRDLWRTPCFSDSLSSNRGNRANQRAFPRVFQIFGPYAGQICFSGDRVHRAKSPSQNMMSIEMRPRGIFLLTISFGLVAIVFSAEMLPPQLSDSEYWKMINDFSEPAGYYQYNVITSNETSYQYSIPDLMKTPRPGGAYLGVGPEQNFTYIAALQPKIAFIFDIRREMMLEHLMYKSVFEMSSNRVQFVANLFSRKAPAQLD